ncbi:heat-inducible transcription repressor HrcA [Thermoactinomyces sp. DSM 45891]|uniref:heat-inducible transcriptional repressor HrcA n=1 Tax=Thermoactinomyces sp. DSM 45891 TaxID=1761907 RepID=UPI00091E4A05|nr:heat-inducible transcriptional repressor HrcA [Thermoactinomyces sp. DSM 45891]SFX66235.1 heat-inducible transcription repressor HrcA [Thermoactinomyces sp. DSM 45891]
MLTERQKRILWAICEDYIESAEPVGSRSVSKKDDVGFSAATIRNEMADLEEMGFLEQPHTSAGRIPSQQGYRFYVDHLLTPQIWGDEEIHAIHNLFQKDTTHIEQAIEHTSELLSQLTNYTSVVIGPKLQDHRLRHLQMIPLTEHSAVFIIVTDLGHVNQQRVLLPEGMSISVMERLVNLLNKRLQGISLSKLRLVVERDLTDELTRYVAEYGNMIFLLDQMLAPQQENRIYTSGTTKMLDQPEFRDLHKMKSLLDLLDGKNQSIIQLLNSSPSSGVQVKIGNETSIEGANHISLIIASFTLDSESIGAIGVLGPTRMEYAKVIGLMDIISKDISKRLTEFYEK